MQIDILHSSLHSQAHRARGSLEFVIVFFIINLLKLVRGFGGITEIK